MQISTNQLYHVYNQGNNKETIFRDHRDYINFLNKVRINIGSISNIICYCLMPNHYHFLISTTEDSIKPIKLGNINSQALKNGFRLLNSSYANDFNKKHSRSGSLFRQKTKFKELENSKSDYPFICFNYIHQNSLKAGIVNKMEDWEYSSFKDYMGLRNGTLCNFKLAYELLDLDAGSFYNDSYSIINEDLLPELYQENDKRSDLWYRP